MATGSGGWKSGLSVSLCVLGALVGATAFGALDHQPGGQAPAFLVAVSGMSAPWLLVPFVAGAAQRTHHGVGLIGLTAAVLAVSVCVATTGYLVDVPPPPSSKSISASGGFGSEHMVAFTSAPWFLGAIVSGPVYSQLGYRWRVSRSWRLALAATAPVMLEPAVRWLATYRAMEFSWVYPPAACTEALTGLALTGAAIVFSRRAGEAVADAGAVGTTAGTAATGAGRRWRSLTRTSFRLCGIVLAAVVTVVFWAPPVARPVVSIGSYPTDLALAPGGRLLYVSDVSDPVSTVTPIDTATLRAGPRINIGGLSGQMFLTRDGGTLFGVAGSSSAGSSWVEWVNLRTGARTRTTVPGGVDAMVLSRDGTTLYVSTDDNTIVPVSVATRRAGRPVRLPPDSLGNGTPDRLALSPDGRTLYADLSSAVAPDSGTATSDEIVGVDTGTGAAAPWRYHDHDVRDMAVALDGRTLYLIGNSDSFDGVEMAAGEHHLTAVNTASGAPVAAAAPLRDGPLALAVTPDGHALAIVYDSEIALMPLAVTGASTGQSESVTGWLDLGDNYDIAISPDSSTIYALTSNGVEVMRVK